VPENKYALSLYIWCCGLVEILWWGALEGGKQVDRTQLLSLHRLTVYVTSRPRSRNKRIELTTRLKRFR
jgi:hypothetical protein